MLPMHANSNRIQKRRQTHRRQQSHEVPILATPLPSSHSKRNHPVNRPGHRRGLSLDQSLSAIQSPSGFRPLHSQDTCNGHPTSGPTFARIPTDTNHTAYPLDQQHFKQETQEHSQAQPGLIHQPAPQHAQMADFQSHLQSQLNGIFNVNSRNTDQAAAMQSLQNHLMWYEQNFGHGQSPNANIQNSPIVQVSHPVAGDMAAPIFLSQPQMPVLPVTSIPHSHSQTVPNTPQDHAQGWPSPPPSQAKHQRSQSYQLDVAPMPPNHDATHLASQGQVFSNGSYNFGGEADYAASAYSSSVADASSPPHQHSTPMPTLFEEPSPNYACNGVEHTDMLFQVVPGAEQDFNSPHFIMGGEEMCTEQAALDAAGIDATYIDTGITEEQINSWLTQPVHKGDPYCCKWEGCGTKINRKENARSHVQNHLDDRRFRCNPCGKRFNRLHDTKRHHLTHTNERPAMCPCGKTFARADALTRHRQRDMCEGVLPGFEKAEEEKPKRGRPKKDRSDGGDRSKKSNRPDMESRARKAALARSMDQVHAAEANGGGSISSAASDRSMPDTPPQYVDELDASDFLNMGGSGAQFNSAASTWLDTPPTSPPSATPGRSETSKVFIDLSIAEEQPESVSPSKLSTRSSPGANGDAIAPSNHGVSSTASERKQFSTDYSSPPAFHPSSGFTGDSSPVDADIDIFNDTVNFDVMDSHPDVGQDVFSPPGESCSGSSVYNSDWDTGVHVGTMKGHAHAGPIKMYNDHFSEVSRGGGFYGIDDFIGAAEEDQYSQVRDILDSWILSH